jgi:hypothetical protein
MATTLIAWRPSGLPAACATPQMSLPRGRFAYAADAVFADGVGRMHVLGQPAMSQGVRTVSLIGVSVPTPIVSTNNSIGAPAAQAVAGAAMTGLVELVSVARSQHAAAKAKGIDARGIPPRGRRRVQ